MNNDQDASARLMEIIEKGNSMLQKEQEEMRKTWERVVAQQSVGAGAGVELNFEGFDPQVKELFNTYQGQPLTQMVFLLYQQCKTLQLCQLFLQGMAAKMAGADSPETNKVMDAASQGQL